MFTLIWHKLWLLCLFQAVLYLVSCIEPKTFAASRRFGTTSALNFASNALVGIQL